MAFSILWPVYLLGATVIKDVVERRTNMLRVSTWTTLFVWVLFSLAGTSAQTETALEILFYGNGGFWLFGTMNQPMESTESIPDLSELEQPTVRFSNNRVNLVAWDRYPNTLQEGIVFATSETYLSGADHQILQSPDSNFNIHYAEARWPLGSRYALITAGLVRHGSIDVPNPVWMLDTSGWLFDYEDQSFYEWNRQCDTLLQTTASNAADGLPRQFAVRCTLFEQAAVGNQELYLTEIGLAELHEDTTEILYTRTDRSEIGWEVSDDYNYAAVVARQSGASPVDKVLVYDRSGQEYQLVTYDAYTQPVRLVSWSPQSRFLAIITSCRIETISTCIRIWDNELNVFVWNAERLNETLSGDGRLYVSSIYWLESPTEFLLLGSIEGANEGNYLWKISLKSDSDVYRVPVPWSVQEIVDVSVTNNETP
jgi:WD40 repeat protein